MSTRLPKNPKATLSIFESRDYLSFLTTHFKHNTQATRGAKAEFARTAGCSTAYLSHILSGKAHLTPEQALAGAEILGLSELEQKYFFYLVLRDRAGTTALRKNFEIELVKIRQLANDVSERFGLKEKPAPEIESRYYSQWYYMAVRLCLFVPDLREPRKIASALELRVDTVRRALEFLKGAGLVSDTKHGLVPVEVNFHLDADAPSIHKHHANWRLKALQNLEQKKPEDIHYTSLITVSNFDAQRVREILLQAVADIREVVANSAPDEGVHCYVVDCFSVATKL